MYNPLITYIEGLKSNTSGIPEKRKKLLLQISDFVGSKLRWGNPAKLTFICTHNSRRSHFCQIWTATLADYIGLEGIRAFSGGTEATAFHPHAIQALERAGFTVENPGGENPCCRVYRGDKVQPLNCFSKKFDHPSNPSKKFAAVMTCSEADENCPVVSGASFRLSIPYEDPKKSDGTSEVTSVYDERCRQIATEMYFALQQVEL